MNPKLTALTATAATTVVQVLAASDQATSTLDGLSQRAHPQRVETVHAELEETRVEVLAARWVGGEQLEQALVDEWLTPNLT